MAGTSGFTVTSVTADQVPDAADNLIDVYDITFTLTNQPGSFNVQVPRDPNAVTDAATAIDAVVTQVAAIYGL